MKKRDAAALSKLIDQLTAAVAKYKLAYAESEALKAEVKALEEKVLFALADAQLEAASGTHSTVARKSSVVPVYNDWLKIFEHIHKERAFDLMIRQLNASAWRERYRDKLLVPGTSAFDKVTLSLTARKKL